MLVWYSGFSLLLIELKSMLLYFENDVMMILFSIVCVNSMYSMYGTFYKTFILILKLK